MGSDTVVDMAEAPEELKVTVVPAKTRATPNERTICGQPLWAAAVAATLCMGMGSVEKINTYEEKQMPDPCSGLLTWDT